VQYNALFAALQQFFATFLLPPFSFLKQLVSVVTPEYWRTRHPLLRRVRCKNQP